MDIQTPEHNPARTELVNYGTHGITNPEGVVFAAGGTIVNALMIFCVLPLRTLLKRKS